MPAAYKRCVKHVQSKGKSKDSAHAICTSVNAGGVKQVRREESRTRKSSSSSKSGRSEHGGHGGR